MTRVDLIIPTLNGSDWLARCLESLQRSTFTDFTLTIFDDGSTEDIASVVQPRFPAARIIRSEHNAGLARAFNTAITTGASEYVVLLNNDTEVEPTWLAELVACADRHPSAGSVASKLRLLSDRTRLHSAGDSWSVRGMPGNRGVWLDDFGQYDSESDVFSACGGAALYRRQALEDLLQRDGHIFDELLFMYCEDVDLGWRMQTAGWPCVFAPGAVVYHALSATGGGTLASYYVSRNVWFVMARSVPSMFLRSYRRRIAAYHLGRAWRALRHLREPAARASLRGMCAGLAAARTLRKHVRELPNTEQQRILGLLDGVDRPLPSPGHCYTHD
ncbi:MAG TPA: glycosyltransferase family 2 protein [Thermomicrobiales bacterium]|nr:glycosyltransferase family 2 protein [Thermomicrobiales bacterium]